MSEDMQRTGTEDSPVEPVWKRRGFDSEESMDKAFASAKDDLKTYKARMRELEVKAQKADEYEARMQEEEASKLTEQDKMRKLLDELGQKVKSHESQLAAKDREITYERLAFKRLSGVPEAEAKLLRRLYDAEASRGFETPEELEERLNVLDADWKAARPTEADDKQPLFTRPVQPGTVTDPPKGGKQTQLDQSKFDDLAARMSKGPSKS